MLEEATPRQRRLLGEHEEAEYDWTTAVRHGRCWRRVLANGGNLLSTFCFIWSIIRKVFTFV
ncbi:hypothetical protein D0O09_31825 [Pseudomonas putida]|nr:hypothetical protein D0O09_31825 [Pseudomonas putida]